MTEETVASLLLKLVALEQRVTELENARRTSNKVIIKAAPDSTKAYVKKMQEDKR